MILVASVFYSLNAFIDFPFMNKTMTMVTVAALNSFYRFIVVVALFPLNRQLELISRWLIRSDVLKDVEDIPLKPLEERFIAHPALAIEQCKDAINDMALKTKDNLMLSINLVNDFTKENYERVQILEKTVDRYEDRLGTYLLKVTGKELNDDQNESTGKFLHTITDFERISDHAVNLAEVAREIHEKAIVFSEDADHELRVVESTVSEIMTMAIDAFINNDLVLAEKIEPLEELIDNLTGELKLHHVQRMKNGICSLNTGFVFNDLINDYERIADHCSNIAVAMIALEADSFDTHEYLESVKQLKSETYAKYFDLYSKKYVLHS